MRRGAAAALVVVLAGGCGLPAVRSAEPGALPAPGPAVAPPAGDEPPLDPDDPALDPALSDPLEDSVYPEIGEPSVDSLRYDLDLAWEPSTRTLTGEATVELRATGEGEGLQLDLAPELEVASVTVDGAPVDFTHDGKDLVVAADVVADERYVLDVAYAGSPQPTPAPTTRSDFNSTGWTVTDDGEVWTMQEPYGAFTWYPVNDQPSDKALYDISITTPAPFTGVANGTLVSQTTEGSLTTSSWTTTSPMSSYLVTVAIGEYERTSNTSASGVEISYWVPADEAQYAERLTYAAEGLDWLEERLGPYPFDSLGFLLVDSESGMETQTMITLGLTSYATSKDVLVHELAHQWYGNEVTPDDWRDVWMNEGMAMYLQGVWQADYEGRDLDDLMDEWASFETLLRAESGPPADYDPTQFGESNIYYGPALMWHELRREIGDERFWEVTRAWPALEPERNANRDEYLPWLVDQTGVEREFFDDWLLSPTTPTRASDTVAG